MYLTFEKGNFDPTIVNELLVYTYEESTQELLEDMYSEGLDFTISTELEEAKRRQAVDYYNFIEEFVNEKSKEQFMAIYKVNDKIVSALRMYELKKDEWFLEALETAISERGNGYGKQLVKAAVEDIVRRNGKLIKAHISKSNIASIAVHKSCGFIQTDNPAQDEDGYIYKNSYEFEYTIL